MSEYSKGVGADPAPFNSQLVEHKNPDLFKILQNIEG